MDDLEYAEFERRNLLINNFKNDLESLCKKYNFGIKESDNYNGMEEYCGTDIYLTVDGHTWYGQTLDEIMEQVFESVGWKKV
jgi:hypothetical protein